METHYLLIIIYVCVFASACAVAWAETTSGRMWSGVTFMVLGIFLFALHAMIWGTQRALLHENTPPHLFDDSLPVPLVALGIIVLLLMLPTVHSKVLRGIYMGMSALLSYLLAAHVVGNRQN